jgi:hypothetical protein
MQATSRKGVSVSALRGIAIALCLLASLASISLGQEAQAYSISGSVLGEDGNPVAAVTMRFSGGLPDVLTSAEGSYSVPVAEAVGDYTLTPFKEGYSFEPTEAEVFISYADASADFYAISHCQPPCVAAIAPDAYEPDDTASTAKTISSGPTQNRSIHAAHNRDWAKFTLSQASAVVIDTNGPSGDNEMSLYGPDSSTHFAPPPYYSDDAHGTWAKIEHPTSNPLPAGTYWIRIQEYDNDGTIPSYTLSLSVGPPETFDDFTYSSASAFTAHGWTIRTQPGEPGIKGATWSASSVSFITDPANPANKLLRLTASTAGTAATTKHSDIRRTSYKYRGGTYAARVYFRDGPSLGWPDGDRVVQTFYAICPYEQYKDSYNYCELDFEYLPNGGWGIPSSTMWMHSWERALPELKEGKPKVGSCAGWHTLVFQVSTNGINYYKDGNLVASHSSIYYPETGMAIAFNHWFDTIKPNTTSRTYREDVDWVYFQKGSILSPSQVGSRVSQLRAAGVAYRDTVQ